MAVKLTTMTKHRYITFDGQTRSVEAWAQSTGLKKSTIFTRLHRGWTVAQALDKELSDCGARMAEKRGLARQEYLASDRKKVTVMGFTGTKDAVARHFDVTPSTLHRRLDRGWSLEEVVVIRSLPKGWSIEFARQQPYYKWLMERSPARHGQGKP